MKIDCLNIDSKYIEKTGLPAEVFKDSDIFETERISIFRNGWVSIANAQQVPEAGDTLPVLIAGYPLLIVRDRDENVQVFHNICRHKAFPLMDKPCSKVNRIVCPYHRWTYDLDGSLFRAPFYNGEERGTMAEDEKVDKGLIPVRFTVWWDIIFVNISGDAKDFEEFISPLNECIKDYTQDSIQLVSSTDYEGSANWKLMVDNFLDGYHVPFVHSQACSVKSIFGQEDLLLSEDIVGIRLPDGTANKHPKTAKPIPPFSGLTEDKQTTQQWFCIFPNTLFFVDPCWVQTIVIKPQAATVSTETLSVYVVNSDAMADDLEEERTSLQKALNQVNEQDIELLQKLQITRSSEAANFGNLLESWDNVSRSFQKLWLSKMTANKGTN